MLIPATDWQQKLKANARAAKDPLLFIMDFW